MIYEPAPCRHIPHTDEQYRLFSSTTVSCHDSCTSRDKECELQNIVSYLNVKLASYSEDMDWSDCYSQLETVATFSDWTERRKTIQLVACLRDDAQAVFGNMESKHRYSLIKL